MTQRKIRCTVVAAALAAVLALAAPVQAASHPRTGARSGWLETVWQWVTGGWPGGGQSGKGAGITINGTKSGYGIDPSGSTVTTQPTDSSTDKGLGVDPNG
jgi:hypothetical protein